MNNKHSGDSCISFHSSWKRRFPNVSIKFRISLIVDVRANCFKIVFIANQQIIPWFSLCMDRETKNLIFNENGIFNSIQNWWLNIWIEVIFIVFVPLLRNRFSHPNCTFHSSFQHRFELLILKQKMRYIFQSYVSYVSHSLHLSNDMTHKRFSQSQLSQLWACFESKICYDRQ